MNKKNVVFMGTPLFAANILKGLFALQKYNFLGAFTQIDKPFGRKKILKAPEVKEVAIELKIPCFQPKKSGEIFEILQGIESGLQDIESNLQNPQDSNINSISQDSKKVSKNITLSPNKFQKIDYIIVVAYGKILKENVVNNYFCINLHGSLLPYFRGASPLQSSIINDYAHFGLSVIHMDSGLDSGDILGVCRFEPHEIEGKTLDKIYEILTPDSINLLESTIDKLAQNAITPLKQDSTKATYCQKFSKASAFLDLADSKACYLRYLALSYIGVWIYHNNEILKINTILGYENTNFEAQKGCILEVRKDRILLACDSGALWIESVTPQNKSKMNITSFLQSKKLKVGDVIN